MPQDISKYKLDADKNLITIDGTNYKITDKTKVYSDTEKILLSSMIFKSLEITLQKPMAKLNSGKLKFFTSYPGK